MLQAIETNPGPKVYPTNDELATFVAIDESWDFRLFHPSTKGSPSVESTFLFLEKGWWLA